MPRHTLPGPGSGSGSESEYIASSAKEATDDQYTSDESASDEESLPDGAAESDEEVTPAWVKPPDFEPSQLDSDAGIGALEEQIRQELLTGQSTVDDASEECQDSLDVDSDGELYDGNVAPAEFYRQNIHKVNVDEFKRKHYQKGTLKLIKNAGNYWQL